MLCNRTDQLYNLMCKQISYVVANMIATYISGDRVWFLCCLSSYCPICCRLHFCRDVCCILGATMQTSLFGNDCSQFSPAHLVGAVTPYQWQSQERGCTYLYIYLIMCMIYTHKYMHVFIFTHMSQTSICNHVSIYVYMYICSYI